MTSAGSGGNNDSKTDRNGKRTLVIAVTSLAILALIGWGVNSYVKTTMVENIASNLVGEDPPEGQYGAGDPNTEDHSDAATTGSDSTRVDELDYAGPKLNSNTKETLARMNKALADMGWGDYGYFERSIAKPSPDNTAQQIWDQVALGSYQAWETAQSDTPGALYEAERLAKGVAGGREYNDLKETFANGGTAVIPIGLVPDNAESPVFNTGQYKEIKNSGYGIKIFTKVNPVAAEAVRVIVRLEKGRTEDSFRWILVKTEKTSLDDISPGTMTQLN